MWSTSPFISIDVIKTAGDAPLFGITKELMLNPLAFFGHVPSGLQEELAKVSQSVNFSSEKPLELLREYIA